MASAIYVSQCFSNNNNNNNNVLLDKFLTYNFPPNLIVWSLSFLSNRSQFVRIGTSNSDLRISNAGTPQGTISGPNDFKLLINDLCFNSPYFKYVDDTTVLSISDDPYDPTLQSSLDDLVNWTNLNGMKINSSKTKEMLLHFGTNSFDKLVPSLTLSNSVIERVQTF